MGKSNVCDKSMIEDSKKENMEIKEILQKFPSKISQRERRYYLPHSSRSIGDFLKWTR